MTKPIKDDWKKTIDGKGGFKPKRGVNSHIDGIGNGCWPFAGIDTDNGFIDGDWGV